jgi:Zn-dependent protease/CBS domain-containing protein
MKANVKLGTVWGIPIGLHSSWFLVFALVIFSLGASYFPSEYPQLSTNMYIILATVTSVGLFASVLLHELGHALLALRNSIPVKSITLFIFGGVAQITREPQSPGVEFRIAIAGPLVSFGLSVLFGGLWLLDRNIAWLAAPSLYLARLNLTLALFNMIPGFPLDGGRVLRSLVWKLTGSLGKATRIASLGGQVVAFGFFGLGIFGILTGNLFNGLWLLFIGWFLQSAATAAGQQVSVQEKLRGVTVDQAMDRRLGYVSMLETLNGVVNDRVLTNGESTFFVVDYDGHTAGLLSLEDITRHPRTQWRFMTAGQVMIPIQRILKVDASAELLSALQRMEETNTHHAAVVRQDRPVGIISRDQVVRYLRLRSELGL